MLTFLKKKLRPSYRYYVWLNYFYDFYSTFLTKKSPRLFDEYYLTRFTLSKIWLISQPRCQKHFLFFNLVKNKLKTISTFRLITLTHSRPKFYKRSPKNLISLIVFIRFLFLNFFKKSVFFICTNFNYNIYNFLLKLNKFMFLNITSTMLIPSYRFKTGYKRRIKKRLLKALRAV